MTLKVGSSLLDTVNSFKKICKKSSILQISPSTDNLQGIHYSNNLKADKFSFTTTAGFYNKFKNKLKNLVKDKDGNFIYRQRDKTKLVEIPKGEESKYDSWIENADGKKYYEKVVDKGDKVKINIDKDFAPLNEETGILVHGTSKDAYNKILKEGFKKSKNFAETFDGIYFTRLADGENTYGEKQIKCLLKGKVATGDINKISDFIYAPTAIDDFLIANNLTQIDATELKQLLLKNEFIEKGYKAVYSTNTNNFAKCKSLVVFNPEDIKIIS